MASISAIPLPSGGKLDEACFSMFLWGCFQLLTILPFFVSLYGVIGCLHPSTPYSNPK